MVTASTALKKTAHPETVTTSQSSSTGGSWQNCKSNKTNTSKTQDL